MKIKVKKAAFSTLRALGDEVMSRVDSRLLSGESAIAIAHWLQHDLKLLTNVKEDSTRKMLERYRETDLRNRTMQRIMVAQSQVPLKTVEKRLNAMDELEEMVRIQRSRVDKVLMKETVLPGGILLKSTSEEIKLLKEMLVDLGRQQLETGVMARASRTFKGQMTDANGEVKEFIWTEEQEKLFKELEGAGTVAEDA
jgi:hypothetical protein